MRVSAEPTILGRNERRRTRPGPWIEEAYSHPLTAHPASRTLPGSNKLPDDRNAPTGRSQAGQRYGGQKQIQVLEALSDRTACKQSLADVRGPHRGERNDQGGHTRAAGASLPMPPTPGSGGTPRKADRRPRGGKRRNNKPPLRVRPGRPFWRSSSDRPAEVSPAAHLPTQSSTGVRMSMPSASPTNQRLETSCHWLAGKVWPRIRIPVPKAAGPSGDSNAVPVIAATSSKCPRDSRFEMVLNTQTPIKGRSEFAKAIPRAGSQATARPEVVTK